MTDDENKRRRIELEGRITGVTNNTIQGFHFADLEVRPASSEDKHTFPVYRLPFGEEDYIKYLGILKEMKEKASSGDGSYVPARFSIEFIVK